jgi:hypothetical protein
MRPKESIADDRVCRSLHTAKIITFYGTLPKPTDRLGGVHVSQGLRAFAVTGAILGLLPLLACGWHGNRYKGCREDATYRFDPPGPEWQPVRSMEDVQVAWINRDLVALIELHGQCDEQGDSSLEEYTDHLRIDWTKWEVLEQKEERMLGRAALRTVVNAELDGVKRRAELVVVKKDGCLFDLRYSAKPSTFERGRPAFAHVVNSFEYPIGSP